MFRILDRYIFREIAQSWLAVTVVLLLILLMLLLLLLVMHRFQRFGEVAPLTSDHGSEVVGGGGNDGGGLGRGRVGQEVELGEDVEQTAADEVAEGRRYKLLAGSETGKGVTKDLALGPQWRLEEASESSTFVQQAGRRRAEMGLQRVCLV